MPFRASCRCGWLTYGSSYLDACYRIRHYHCDKSGCNVTRDTKITPCPREEYDAWRMGQDSRVYWYAIRHSRQLVEADRSHA